MLETTTDHRDAEYILLVELNKCIKLAGIESLGEADTLIAQSLKVSLRLGGVIDMIVGYESKTMRLTYCGSFLIGWANLQGKRS